MLALVDYGSGNIRSVERALGFVGAHFTLTEDPEVVARASGVVLPGVGAAADTMNGLRARGMDKAVSQYLQTGRPFMGVCMGLHALLEHSEENDGTPCLGLFPGRVRRFPPGLHVPHMGWNQVRRQQPCALLDGVPDDANFYFVHSYFADAAASDYCAATTEYGLQFLSVLGQDVIFATQFHPEKSGAIGLSLYRNFTRICGQQ